MLTAIVPKRVARRRRRRETTRTGKKKDFGFTGTKTETSAKPRRTRMVCW
jgi:hypothetical protein